MSQRELIFEQLHAFYRQRGLSADSFACQHATDRIRDAAPLLLAQGAEAHLGTRYGAALRVLVMSLDTGGSADTVAGRTSIIESLPGKQLNPHMRGTQAIAAELLRPDIGEEEPYPYFAMINAAKCSYDNGKMHMVPASLYERCRPFAWEELQLVAPEVIVTQGKRARDVLPSGKRPTRTSVDSFAKEIGPLDWVADWLWALTCRCLKWIQVAGTDALTAVTPHPAAQGGQWQRFAALNMKPVAEPVRALVVQRRTARA